MFIINFLEFNDLFKITINRLLKHQGALLEDNPKELKFISRNANRLFLNFLSSGRTFLDHTETYLKRKYGSQSNEYLIFQSETNKIYDNSFEYRFMYKLRNYAQHCGLPINNITYSINNDFQGDKYVRNINLNPTFDLIKLSNDFKKWGSTLKEDFKLKPNEISVTSVLKEYYRNIEVLSNKVLIIEKKSLQESIEYLETFEEKFTDFEQSENLQLCVFYNFQLSKPNSYENSKFETYKLPKELIKEIKEKTTANNV